MKEYKKRESSGIRGAVLKDVTALGQVRVLCLCAMLSAMSVVLAYLAKLVFGLGALRVTFENFPIIFGGIAFGPLAGALVAIVADLCSCLWAAQAPNPLILVGAAAVGVTAGVLGRYVLKKKQWWSLFWVELAAQFLGSVLLKSFALHVYYGYAPLLLLLRVPIYLGIAICESYLLCAIYKNKSFVALLERMCRK